MEGAGRHLEPNKGERMSATIYWDIVNPKRASLGVGAPQSFITAMSRAGMELPCTVGHIEYDKINAMAAVYGDNSDNPYRKLCELILELPSDGLIRLEAEY